MTANSLRSWGMAVSASIMVAALLIAAQPHAAARGEAADHVRQLAQAPTPSHVGFIVRFQGEGPIARAQAAAGRGGGEAARREIEAQLVRQAAFNGLCFDRFTVGAAEVVLRSCEAVPAAERAAFEASWLARLRAMRAVDYADANATMSAERG
ncbi:MAG: hypothetical protein K2P58_04095 [Hyphomonadaceae bacterium]|nr:hypothetical protein [Hyphomonadaceae bacterium]